MLEQRVQFGIDHFVEPGYFEPMSDSYVLTEESKDGKTRLDVHICHRSLCISDFDSKGKCSFLNKSKDEGLQKSSDHLIFYKTKTMWKLCIIEMKTSVGGNTWQDIKLKTRASLLNAMAIASILGIGLTIEGIQVYTTYEKEAFNKIENSTAPLTYKIPLGSKVENVKKEEWDKNRIRIKMGDYVYLQHTGLKLQRNNNENQLEGKLVIEGE